MVEVVNKSQQLFKAAVYPISAYSRIVYIRFPLMRIGASDGGGHTPGLGNRVWLQGIDLWLQPMDAVGFMIVNMNLMAGGVREPVPVNIRDTWDPIMQASFGPTPTMLIQGNDIHMHWTMSKLYTGDARRFGVYAQILGAGVACMGMVAFQIAEG